MASSKNEPTEDLGAIGGDPHNAIQMKPVPTAVRSEDIPPGGFIAKLEKSKLVGEMKAALAKRLDVDEAALELAYEGERVDESKTVRDNGIVEPGPAARRNGVKVEMLFMIKTGIETGAQKARREEEEERERIRKEQEEEAAKRQKEEEEARRREENERQMHEKKLLEAKAEQQRQEEERIQNRLVIRCLALGGSQGQELETASTFTVAEVARQLSDVLNMHRDAGHDGGLLLLFNGQPLPGRQTMRDAGVKNGDEVVYFWGEGGVAVEA
eukprot:TRINITY_DN50448_c0_g1_i1.p1 TRINITY_DN50448_c0_g1~~TRINITY_DN50448_c0_g1_i1.p1  ORF type:complete len:270 (+),score=91.09 TRINITY_DN50448_c0_g1_i1:47-856(+)